jgi:cysteine desulfuration protein SufE
MATVAQKIERLVDELSVMEDPQERMQYLIDLVRDEPPLPADLKVPAFKIEGCVAQLWLVPEFRQGQCFFMVDSDGIISRAVAFALADTVSGGGPTEILEAGPEFLSEVGITQHLTPNRRSGLAGVWARIQSFCGACAKEVS